MLNAVSSNSPPADLFSNVGNKQDLFLKILSMELSHQNPLAPMDNSQWVGQLAQFSLLNQNETMNSTLQSLTEATKFMHCTALLGRTVSYLDASGVERQGVVEAVVQQKDGRITLTVDGEAVVVADLISVSGVEL